MEGNPAKEPSSRKALGRGLAALIPDRPPQPTAASSGLRQLPVERIRPNKRQPRKQFDEDSLEELAASIRSQGVLQPIVVRRVADHYEIVAGERRWRAASRSGLHEIPAVIKDLADSDALQVALIENLQRQDLDPLEEAEAFGRLIREHGLTHEQIASGVGKSRSAITNSMRLLKLPENTLAMLADGRLTAGHARALMSLDDDGKIDKLAQDIHARGLSVREAEHKVRQQQQSGKQSAQAEGKSPAVLDVEQRLQRALGTKVRLHHRRGRGRIEIHFHSLDELDGLLDKLDG